MMSASANNPLLLFNCLERFEKQSREITNRNDLVEFFCRHIIPLFAENSNIEDLRNEWKSRRDQLNQNIHETEAQALHEIKNTFQKIKAAVGHANSEVITQKITLIERLITGQEKWYGSPLYRFLYDELKQLFQLLLEAGHEDLCKKYANLATHKKYVQKDPNQGERWVYVLEGGRTSHFLSTKELEEVQKRGNENLLLPIPPDYTLMDETYIVEFSFAPSVIDAYAAMDAVHWDRLQDPVIVWWYFESALWCWQTPEFYFDQVIRPKNGQDHGKHFRTICEKSAWREIAAARDRIEPQTLPIIFTEHFFRAGLGTLINAISAYLSQNRGSALKLIPLSEQAKTTFELQLDGNELWINVTFENQATEKFYVQKFHEGSDADGSSLFKFVKGIFEAPGAGEKKAKLVYRWESTSKHISRIKLPNPLKQAFFEKSYSSTFLFKGIQIALKSDKQEIISHILTSLRQNHLKSIKTITNICSDSLMEKRKK